MIDDCFYEESVEKGVPFQVRRSNFLRDMPVKKKPEKDEEEKEEEIVLNLNKTLTIPDDELKRQQEMEAAAIVEAKRDRTFEEFEEMYGDHILGKIDPELRVGGRPVTAGFGEEGQQPDAGVGARRPSGQAD